MSLQISDVVWRLQKKGLLVSDYQIRWALRQGRVKVTPLKNRIGHNQFTEADYAEIERHFREKQTK